MFILYNRGAKLNMMQMCMLFNSEFSTKNNIVIRRRLYGLHDVVFIDRLKLCGERTNV